MVQATPTGPRVIINRTIHYYSWRSPQNVGYPSPSHYQGSLGVHTPAAAPSCPKSQTVRHIELVRLSFGKRNYSLLVITVAWFVWLE